MPCSSLVADLLNRPRACHRQVATSPSPESFPVDPAGARHDRGPRALACEGRSLRAVAAHLSVEGHVSRRGRAVLRCAGRPEDCGPRGAALRGVRCHAHRSGYDGEPAHVVCQVRPFNGHTRVRVSRDPAAHMGRLGRPPLRDRIGDGLGARKLRSVRGLSLPSRLLPSYRVHRYTRFCLLSDAVDIAACAWSGSRCSRNPALTAQG